MKNLKNKIEMIRKTVVDFCKFSDKPAQAVAIIVVLSLIWTIFGYLIAIGHDQFIFIKGGLWGYSFKLAATVSLAFLLVGTASFIKEIRDEEKIYKKVWNTIVAFGAVSVLILLILTVIVSFFPTFIDTAVFKYSGYGMLWGLLLFGVAMILYGLAFLIYFFFIFVKDLFSDIKNFRKA